MEQEFDFDVAISCSRSDGRLASCLYRRLIEAIPDNRVYFYFARDSKERNLTGKQLEERLSKVYSSSRLVVFMVGHSTSDSLQQWEISNTVKGQHEGHNVDLFLIRREGCKNPKNLERIIKNKPTLYEHLDEIRDAFELPDIDRILGAIKCRYQFDREREPSHDSVSRLEPPTVVTRHIQEFKRSEDFKGDVDKAGCRSRDSCDVARSGIHSTAAVLGSAEQYQRAIEIFEAFRQLGNLLNLESGLTKKHYAASCEGAKRHVEHRLLRCLWSRPERSLGPDKDLRTALEPDALQLIARLDGYLRFHISDGYFTDKIMDSLRDLIGLSNTKRIETTLLRDLAYYVEDLIKQLCTRLDALKPSSRLSPPIPESAIDSLHTRLTSIAEKNESTQFRQKATVS